jgi:DNA replication initiation complex subunit (GINS family)
MLEREKKFFREVLHTCDDSQIQWILEHDYPEEEKELAKEEQNKRKS